MKLKILLINLPLQEFTENFNNDFPLSLFCLKQALLNNFNEKFIDIKILPSDISSKASDSIIKRKIIGLKPNIIGFSCYLWNIERSLWIAEQVKLSYKKESPIIIIGGPEITPDNFFVMNSSVWDFAVQGKGEEALCKIVDRITKGKIINDPFIITQNQNRKYLNYKLPTGLSKYPVPHHKKIINPNPYTYAHIETMRGCPHKCTYCVYNHFYSKIICFSNNYIKESLNFYRKNNIKNLYLMDPTFNNHPEFNRVTQLIINENKDRFFSFHTEVKAESITKEQAKILYNCNVTSVETGLQTTTIKSLKQIKRTFNPELFITGIKNLCKYNIKVTIGTIIGLPGDNIEGVKNTIEFLKKIKDINVEPYILSLLPGTEIRKNADEFGIIHQKMPPYQIIRSNDFSAEDILTCITLYEQAFFITLDPFPTPSLPLNSPDKISQIKYRKEKILLNISESSYELNKSKKFLTNLLQKNPFTIIDLYLIPEKEISLNVINSLLSKCFNANHPINRYFQNQGIEIASTRVSIALSSGKRYKKSWIKEISQQIPVYRITKNYLLNFIDPDSL